MISSREVMTSILDLDVEESVATAPKDSNHNICHQHRNVLRSKYNTHKHKCKKILKRKLKKYKLRQDGKEDQDIIDVSDTLVASLFIRSPTKTKDSFELETEQLRRKNYLFRMVKRKQTTLKTTKNIKHFDKVVTQNDKVVQISPGTEEKKQTNAFKLLMESRNKSIGTNSPGKERPNNESDTQEIIEKKTLKAKRALMLQKMSEEKGALKKRVIEEQHEKYVNKKMEKRAEKLKSMLLHKEPKPGVDVKVKHEEKIDRKDNDRSPLDSIEPEKNVTVVDKSVNKLQLVNIFSETMEKKISPKKKLTKEDKEFLSKLSPSIRKKESMLSYFKKIEKEPDMSEADAENDNSIIKVKLGKPKKKGKKKKLSLNRNNEKFKDPEINIKNAEEEEILIVVEIKEEEEIVSEVPSNIKMIISEETNKERRKRKREAIENMPNVDNTNYDSPNSHSDERRPKRIVKKPIKYNDDAGLTSSDEELHIFTPKKKKHLGKDKTATQTDEIIIIDDKKISKVAKKSTNDDKPSKKDNKLTNDANPPKSVKLAPIFSKPQPDAATIEARQKFLQSGVPEQLKKLMSKQKSCNTGSCNIFPTVVHVQQLEAATTLPTLKLPLEDCLEEISLKNSAVIFLNLLNLTTSDMVSLQSKNNVNTQTYLQNLKEAYPRFPVYRTYKLLRGKKKGEFRDSNTFSNLDNSVEILNCSIDMQTDNPDQLTWCDKYKPLSGNEIIGNFDSIRELKKWLVTWTENDNRCKVNGNDSDSSDYYQSEPDSRDSMKCNNNLLILSGPTGCGKTSAVYAVAAELSIKVIEVNSSSRRTGKIMLQDLQEATQSHKVNRAGGSSENSQKCQEMNETPPEIQIKKRGRPKKLEQTTPIKMLKKKTEKAETNSISSQESTRTAMSLILIDDADIVFEQDDGFCSAITQLVQSSKRPVILVTGSLSLPHLQKFMQCGKILKMHALLPNMLGTWLDLMCLADSGTCWPGLGAKFLNFNKGDMRKTINCLQFYVGSQDQGLSGDSPIDSQNNDMKINTDDENSCMSWADRDTDNKNVQEICDTDSQSVWNSFTREHMDLKHSNSLPKLFDTWWSLPKILTTQTDSENACKVQKSIELISNVLDSISVGDYMSPNQFESEANLTSRPWYDGKCDSVSELENLDNYDRKYDTTRDICRELLLGSLTAAQNSMGLENKYEIDFPGMSIKRKRDCIVSRHKELTSYLSPQSSLDRKALALDYWSSCRDICRIEKSKTDNFKRNNRFCHYLKSLSVLCKSESFDNLANSLQPGL